CCARCDPRPRTAGLALWTVIRRSVDQWCSGPQKSSSSSPMVIGGVVRIALPPRLTVQLAVSSTVHVTSTGAVHERAGRRYRGSTVRALHGRRRGEPFGGNGSERSSGGDLSGSADPPPTTPTRTPSLASPALIGDAGFPERGMPAATSW